MSTRKKTWEIVLAGLLFMAIGIYMLSRSGDGAPSHAHSSSAAPDAPQPPLPSSIVIDLQNLEDIKNIRNLKDLDKLKNLEIKLRNLDQLIQNKGTAKINSESLEHSLEQVEKELQQIEDTDFRVMLQDKKIFINKDYNVRESHWTEVSPGVYVFREAFDAGTLNELKLKLDYGTINIVGTDDQSAEFTLRATGDFEDPNYLQQQFKVSKSSGTNSLSIAVGPSESGLSDEVNLEATLSIPGNLPINASTGGGHINANSLDGNNVFTTNGGHIKLVSVSGSTQAKTKGGHITCNKLQGKARLHTSGGHIRVNGGEANLFARTGGGHIVLTDFSGEADAKTKGGNIEAKIDKVEGPLTLASSAGNISLAIPSSTAADIDARGSKVTLDEGFGFVGKHSKGHLTGTLNGGGAPLSLSCGYGNVEITHD